MMGDMADEEFDEIIDAVLDDQELMAAAEEALAEEALATGAATAGHEEDTKPPPDSTEEEEEEEEEDPEERSLPQQVLTEQQHARLASLYQQFARSDDVIGLTPLEIIVQKLIDPDIPLATVTAQKQPGQTALPLETFLRYTVPALCELQLTEKEFEEIIDNAREEGVRRMVEVAGVPDEWPESQHPEFGAAYGMSPEISISLDQMHQDFSQPKAGGELTPLETLVRKIADPELSIEGFRKDRVGGGDVDMPIEELFTRLAPIVNMIENESEICGIVGLARRTACERCRQLSVPRKKTHCAMPRPRLGEMALLYSDYREKYGAKKPGTTSAVEYIATSLCNPDAMSRLEMNRLKEQLAGNEDLTLDGFVEWVDASAATVTAAGFEALLLQATEAGERKMEERRMMIGESRWFIADSHCLTAILTLFYAEKRHFNSVL